VSKATAGGGGIAVIGDRIDGFEPQDTIEPALRHAAAQLGLAPPAVRWFATDALAESGPVVLYGSSAVWCAPGGPYRSLAGALEGIRWTRQNDVPFLGTCAGFQHGVIEFARNVLGYSTAAHAEYGEADGADLFIDELLCSLVGQSMAVEIIDEELRGVYGSGHAIERYYCRFGLHPQWRHALNEAGLLVAGVDAVDRDVRILRLAGHRFFVLTLFVPQTASAPSAPHPLITGLVAAAARRAWLFAS
jgi:CTP synthase (UTP-ammonia lyase)